MRIGQTSIIVFASSLLASAFGFVATIYFARILGAEVLGYWALLLSLQTWLQFGSDPGISSAITKRISEGSEQSKYFTAGFLIIVSVLFAIVIGVFLAQGTLNDYIGADLAYLLPLLLFAGQLSVLVGSTLKGEHLVHVGGLLSPLREGSRSVIQISLVLLGFGIVGLVIGYVVSGVIVALLSVYFLSVRIRRPSMKHIRGVVSFAKYAWIGGLRNRAFKQTDILIMGFFVSPSLVGIYSIIWSLVQFLKLFGSAVRSAFFPEISRKSQDSIDLVAGMVDDSVAYGGLAIIPGLVGGIVLDKEILLIYGREFGRGTEVMGLLIFSMVLYEYQSHLLNAINAIDRPDVTFNVNAIFIGANIVLNIILIPRFGWYGAAIATVLSAVIGLILAYQAIIRLIPIQVKYRFLLEQIVAALFMGGIVEILKSPVDSVVYSEGSIIAVGFLVVTGAFLYFVFLTIISKTFKNAIKRNLIHFT